MHSPAQVLGRSAAWTRLLHGNRARPLSGMHAEACETATLAAQALARGLARDDEHSLRQWRERFSDPGAKLTDFIVDDALEAFAQLAPRVVRVHRCTWLFDRLVPVYTALSDGAAAEAATGGGDTARKESILRNARVGEWLRRATDNVCPGAAAPLIVVPVVRDGHFWLYILNVLAGTLEFYDSLSGAAAVTDEPFARGGAATTLAERALLWYAERYCGGCQLRVLPTPQRDVPQHNVVDCGVFVCIYVYLRAAQCVQQAHVGAFREYMVAAAAGVVHDDIESDTD